MKRYESFIKNILGAVNRQKIKETWPCQNFTGAYKKT